MGRTRCAYGRRFGRCLGKQFLFGVPGPSAGNLETKASKDLYTFTVPAGGKTLFLDFRSCVSNKENGYLNGLTWQVTSVASGAKVAGDYCSYGNKTVALPAGDYRLEMGTDISRNSYGKKHQAEGTTAGRSPTRSKTTTRESRRWVGGSFFVVSFEPTTRKPDVFG